MSKSKRTAIFIAACHTNVDWLTNVYPSSPLEVYVGGCESQEMEAVGCRDEAHQYLRFIVDRYDDLPSRILFVHGHQLSSHYDWPLDQMIELLFNHTEYMNSVPFGGLYCRTGAHPAAPGWCVSSGIRPEECTEARLWERMYQHTGIKQPAVNDYLFPCCGTFFVTRQAIQTRGRHVYERILHNMDVNFDRVHRDTRVCGRILESSWHKLFLAPGTGYTPPPYCDVHQPFETRGKCPLQPCPSDFQTKQARQIAGWVAIGAMPVVLAAVFYWLGRRSHSKLDTWRSVSPWFQKLHSHRVSATCVPTTP